VISAFLLWPPARESASFLAVPFLQPFLFSAEIFENPCRYQSAGNTPFFFFVISPTFPPHIGSVTRVRRF